MNVFKQFNASDIVTTPFVVNKAFAFSGSNNFTGSDIGIDAYVGTKPNFLLFNSQSAETTGYIKKQYKNLVYKSIRQLYYSNYYTQEYGDNAATASIIKNDYYTTGSEDVDAPLVNLEFINEETGNPQFNITGPGRTTNYYNYLSNTLTASRTLENIPDSGLGVVSIPSNLYGEYIKPGSFKSTVTSNGFQFICTDDGLGNIFTNDNSGNKQAGNIIYEHGLIIYTLNSFTTGSSLITLLTPSTYVTNSNLKVELVVVVLHYMKHNLIAG